MDMRLEGVKLRSATPFHWPTVGLKDTVRVGAVRGLTGRSFVPLEPDPKELSL